MAHTFDKDVLKDKVVKGQHDEVFEELLIDKLHEDLTNQVHLLESRHTALEKSNNQGLLSRDAYILEKVRINNSLLLLIDDIEDELVENTDAVTASTASKSSDVMAMSSSSPTKVPLSLAPTKPSRSGTFSLLYMAIAVFVALIFGALFVLIGLYLLGNNNRMETPEPTSYSAEPVYVYEEDDTDSISVYETAVTKEEPKSLPLTPSKEAPLQKLDVFEVVNFKIPTLSTPVSQPTRYKCQANCKSIKFVYAGFKQSTKFDISIEANGQHEQALGEILNSQTVPISIGNHIIKFKDKSGEYPFPIFIGEQSKCITFADFTEPICRVECSPKK